MYFAYFQLILNLSRINRMSFILSISSEGTESQSCTLAGSPSELHSLTDTFAINRTPGNIPRAYFSLRSELTDIIKNRTTNHEDKLQIKISGDGTKVTRISNFIVISFSILSAEKLSADEQKVLAIVKSSEQANISTGNVARSTINCKSVICFFP
jgi:hypothetical protein